METTSYTLTPGWQPNPVHAAAIAFLEAAILQFKTEELKTGFLQFQNWFVTHHLAFIACELFLKSLQVTITDTFEQYSPDPTTTDIQHAFNRHHFKFTDFTVVDFEKILSKLSPSQRALVKKMGSDKDAKNELARGRYPYEVIDGNDRWPAGDVGKALADEWIDLAQTLKALSTQK